MGHLPVPCTTILAKGILQTAVDQQGFGQGVPNSSASAMLRPSVRIGWSRHTREPLHQFKVGYKPEMSISLAGSFLQLSEAEFSLSLASLQQDSKLLLLYS